MGEFALVTSWGQEVCVGLLDQESAWGDTCRAQIRMKWTLGRHARHLLRQEGLECYVASNGRGVSQMVRKDPNYKEGDVKSVYDPNRGITSTFFGGKDAPDGAGHGHIDVNEQGEVTFERDSES